MNKLNQAPSAPPQDYGIDLRELFRVLWSGKWLIGGTTIGAAVIAVVISLMLPNIYRAEALLAPNSQEGTGGLSALAAQYGGLASLAGINLGGGATDKTALGLEILKSRKFISDFVERHALLVPLIAAKGWNSTTGELSIDTDAYDEKSGKWIRDVKPPKKKTPSSQEAFKEFADILSVRHNKETGFIVVAVEHYSPEIAKQWVDWLVADLNHSIMSKDVAEAEQAIEYLNKQIENTPLSELKSVFFSLIEEQTKTVMLAKVTDEYLFKTLDPAVAPEKKSKPKRAVIVILCSIFGLFVGVLLVLISTRWRVQKPE